MDPRAHLFGIRHHGPGSAASLVAALDALDPALVLIEGAPEAESLAGYAALAGMQPPLAILHYQADEPANAIFAPFAEYSPEWQAMRWALARGRAIRFIDWPAAHALAFGKPHDAPLPEEDDDAHGDKPEPPPPPSYADPLDMLATIAGYADGEAWWNAMVESSQAGPAMFAAIEAAITELRDASEAEGGLNPQREARDRIREAFMRLALRAALKDESGDIAVVVGAWHVPALRAKVPQAEDRTTIRGLEKVKVESAWVPWSDSRLASASGYGAGVTAPGWYRHLWQLRDGSETSSPEAFAAGWQSRVSGLLREEGHAVASASTIEASRLAITLAALRGEATPGLAEMHDATLAALCHGDEVAYRLVERRLLFGERVGAVDPAVPQMPLAADLERWQKRCRLKPEDLEREIALDLRTEAGLMKSTLLHRLTLINVPWGRLLDAEAGRGTFRETWRLAWNPGLAVNLAEALVYGVTIAQAAAGKAMAQSRDSNDVAALAGLVKACLLADLPDAAEHCITRLQAAAVGSGDLVQLMNTVPTLVLILRYGTARPIPSEQLGALVSALAAEINAGAQAASVDIEPAEAEAMRRAMAGYDRALALHGEPHLTEMWFRELAALVQHDRSAPAVAGLALRLLHEGQVWEVERIAASFSRALTPPAAPAAAGAFVESFLAGGAEVLIQDRPLLASLDTWLCQLDDESFIALLPMLRRGFSDFAETGRQRILGIIGSGTIAAARGPGAQDNDASPAFIAQALPLLRTILGITP